MRFLAYGDQLDEHLADQVENNFEYHKKKGNKLDYDSPEDWLNAIDIAGEKYSKAHAKLKVYNEAQKNARDAAVNLGKMDWKAAYANIKVLDDVINKGQKAWKEYALETGGSKEPKKKEEPNTDDIVNMFRL